jgi:hypothetical protein
MTPAWIRCTCGNYWCTIHNCHAHDCPCPPIEEWDIDPYTEAPDMPATPTLQLRITDAERARLAELGRRLAIAGRPLSMADVIRVAVERLEAETGKRKKNPR